VADRIPEARLLVVDDEPSIRRRPASLSSPASRCAAPRTVQALRWPSSIARLVVLDVMLPDFDGFAVTASAGGRDLRCCSSPPGTRRPTR
jgi:two-component system OmpR family response regulator